ncbi:RNI-like protein, partial [Aulographum hederae CBS 113979]
PWDRATDPVDTSGPRAEPMPVDIGAELDFNDVFSYLKEDPPYDWKKPSAGPNIQSTLQGFNAEGGEEPTYSTPVVEFKRGFVYEDGRLDLCKQVVGPDHIDSLMDSLDNNLTIRHFLLGNNVITGHGARRIARFIHEHQTQMETWYLAGNVIKAKSFSDIIDALVGSPVQTNLWMKRNPLGEESALALFSLITGAPKLRTLDLEVVQLGDSGCARLFQMLAAYYGPVALESIYLNGNGVAVEGCKAIASFLKKEICRLTELFMGSNPVGSDGADALAEGITRNKTLLRLNLSSYGISSNGLRHLFLAVSKHPSIMSFDMSKAITHYDLGARGNHISTADKEELVDLIKNPSLRFLTLGHLSMDP